MIKLITRAQARLNTVRSEEDGATAVEYGLIVALIAAIIVATVALLGTEINNAFTTVLNAI